MNAVEIIYETPDKWGDTMYGTEQFILDAVADLKRVCGEEGWEDISISECELFYPLEEGEEGFGEDFTHSKQESDTFVTLAKFDICDDGIAVQVDWEQRQFGRTIAKKRVR